MPVNVALGHVSNAFMIAALVIYSLSVVAFAGDFAFGRPRRADISIRPELVGSRKQVFSRGSRTSRFFNRPEPDLPRRDL